MVPAFSTAPAETRSPLLTMCRMRIRADCRTSDVTTCQKCKSPIDRSLGGRYPRMLSSCSGKDPQHKFTQVPKEEKPRSGPMAIGRQGVALAPSG